MPTRSQARAPRGADLRAPVAGAASPAAPRAARPMYVLIALTCLLIALVGFWARYFGPLASGRLTKPPIIHGHAIVMVGWLVLVISQALLVATGHRALHVRVGRFGMAWGVLVILVGWATALDRFGEFARSGRVQAGSDRLFAPLTDLLVFAPFLAAAWAYRRRPEVHKRLIVVATTVLLIAAVHRIRLHDGTSPLPLPALLLLWLSPILLGMAYDAIRHRKVHPVYVMGMAAVGFLKFGRVPLRDTGVWRAFAAWVADFYI